ncbi:M15 family metallopeptidase [Lichenifustis flavocetrariae]|uniref:D-alanyl-D-alanine dipeptidase n=1 Tax=Lichenifustis flavocetrariae TaxID=2949735 RepID=A0AA42CGY2_9HYPH|nr:M15 family metallopeptidase [Lichenifustis flavocetrariae]MCW6507023.1 M15 family metallopeptidase [Lichenifustis flavocetrariae]
MIDTEGLLATGDFVEITPGDGVVLDIRYSTTNNFVGRPIYGGFDRLILHRIAGEKLCRAVTLLNEREPGWKLLVFDGLRPNTIQQIFWDLVRGTPQQIYVGDPAIGSIHGFGLAVDLSLLDESGREVDMGTPFDDFTPLAEPRREAAYLATGALTPAQVRHRALLRHVMEAAGFQSLAIEWWHFDALPPEIVRAQFRLMP